MTCKQRQYCRTAKRRGCDTPRRKRSDDGPYTPGGGGFGFVLIGAFVLWLLGCSGVLSLIF